MLTCDPMRVVQHGLDLLPHGLIQLIATDCSIAARRLTAIPVRIRAGAPIVAVVGVSLATHFSTRHLAVEGVAAESAHYESLQQPSRPTAPVALSTAVLVQLRLSSLEHVGIDDRRYRDRDPFLLWNRH